MDDARGFLFVGCDERKPTVLDLAEISILDLDSASHQHEAVRKRKFEPELECKALPTVPQFYRWRNESRTRVQPASDQVEKLFGL